MSVWLSCNGVVSEAVELFTESVLDMELYANKVTIELGSKF